MLESAKSHYGERWRNEESIATGFVESAVNQIVSKRFAKKATDAVDEEECPSGAAKYALRCSMNAWKIPFVIGIRSSGENPLTTSSTRRLEHPLFYALLSLGSGRFGGDNFRLFDHGRFYKKLLGLGEQGFCNFTRKVIIAPLRIRKCIEDTELRGTELKRIPAGRSSFRHRHRECRL